MWWMHIAIWIFWHNSGTLLQAKHFVTVSNEWCHAPRVSVDLGFRVALTFGMHPHVAVGWEDWSSLQQRMYSQKCVAVGECGLDYIHPRRQQQRRVFQGRFDSPKQWGSLWHCTYGARREVMMKPTWKPLACFWRRLTSKTSHLQSLLCIPITWRRDLQLGDYYLVDRVLMPWQWNYLEQGYAARWFILHWVYRYWWCFNQCMS